MVEEKTGLLVSQKSQLKEAGGLTLTSCGQWPVTDHHPEYAEDKTDKNQF